MLPHRVVNPEVITTTADITTAGPEEISLLRAMAAANPRGRARLCAHRDDDDLLHEMLIVLTGGTYIPPHRHNGKSESFHLIEGSLTVVVFDEDGTRLRRIDLAAPGQGRSFFYRLAAPFYHTVIPTSDFAVFHETTNGPFRRKETAYAPWAPGENDDPTTQCRFIEGCLSDG